MHWQNSEQTSQIEEESQEDFDWTCCPLQLARCVKKKQSNLLLFVFLIKLFNRHVIHLESSYPTF